jgi:hypothetical protein
MVRGVITTTVTLLWLLLANKLALAALSAQIDRQQIIVGESFVLQLESDRGGSANPDLTPLERDFEIHSQSQGTTVQIINGRATSQRRWQITLVPRRSGALTIPPLKLNGDTSPAISIQVMDSGTRADSITPAADLLIEVEATPRQAWVQQQIILTIRLLRTVDLGSGSTLSDPDFGGANIVVERLGEDRTYTTQLNGRRYNVIERNFALFPQQSGELTMAPIQFDGRIVEGAGTGSLFAFDPFNQRTRVRRLQSESLTLEILSRPAGYPARHWLPASNLQLVEEWPAEIGWRVGEPVTRSVALVADGLTAAQLPAITPDSIDGLRLYADQPLQQDSRDARGVSASRQERVALIPTRAGTLQIPSIEIPWWNVASGKLEVARLPSRTIEVLPPAPSIATPAISQPVGAAPLSPLLTSLQPHDLPLLWPLATLVMAIGWLLTLLIWWRQRRQPSPSSPIRPQPASGEVRLALRVACRDGDSQRAAQALLEWARQQWPNATPRSLPAIAQRCGGELASELITLDSAYYRGEALWQGNRLWLAWQRYYTPAAASSQSSREDPLPPLVPG